MTCIQEHLATSPLFIEGATCRGDCVLNLQDDEAMQAAAHNGETGLAERIRNDKSERHARCAGPVACAGVLDCGVKHGHLRRTIKPALLDMIKGVQD